MIKPRMRWAKHVARMGERRGAYRLLVGKKPLGRPRRRLVDSIWAVLREIVGVVWTGWGQVESS
jgi:hypothetical protein